MLLDDAIIVLAIYAFSVSQLKKSIVFKPFGEHSALSNTVFSGS